MKDKQGSVQGILASVQNDKKIDSSNQSNSYDANATVIAVEKGTTRQQQKL